MSSPISTHDADRIRAAFAALPQPRQKYVELLNSLLELGGTFLPNKAALGPFRRMVSAWTENVRLEALVWRWLRPDPPRMTLDAITTLLESPGQYSRQFVAKCEEHARNSPELGRYIGARLAEFSFLEEPADIANIAGLADFELYQRSLFGAALGMGDFTAEATETASTGIAQVLGAIAAATARVLDPKGGEGATVEANLMLYSSSVSQTESAPAEAAEWLWSEVRRDAHGFFCVVGETPGARNEGFWIPDVRPKGQFLPGAPIAYHRGSIEALFIDDLPNLPFENSQLNARWFEYLSGEKIGHFSGNMFVSIPVRIHATRAQERSVAVVNVNIRSSDPWLRGYSNSWRGLLQETLKPLLSLCAHLTFLVIYGERQLKTAGASRFDSFEVPEQFRRLMGAESASLSLGDVDGSADRK